MKVKVLIDELNKFLKRLDSVYNINSGGCFYVAYLIARELDNLGINYTVVDWHEDSRLNEYSMYHRSLKVDNSYVNPPLINYGNYINNLGYISPYKLSRDSGKYSLGLLKPSVRFKIRDSIVKFFKEYNVAETYRR